MDKLNSMRVLDQAGIPYTVRAFEAAHLSAVDVAERLGVDPARVYKTLVALPISGKPVLAMVPAAGSLDLKGLAKALGVKSASMASQAEAESLSGLQVGGIGALALRHKGWRLLLDRSALTVAGGRIFVSAGRRGINLEVAVADILRLLQPVVADLVRPTGG